MKTTRISKVVLYISICIMFVFLISQLCSAGFPNLKYLKERNCCLEFYGFSFAAGLTPNEAGYANGNGVEIFYCEWCGSGFLVDEDGTILTNYHVARKAIRGRAIFDDGTTYDITHIKVYNPHFDIAVLKLKATKEFPYVKLGNSDKIEVMDKILAVGNTLGEGFSVSEGMINNIKKDENDMRWRITHSATIAPGNSGGALYKDDKVVGINVAMHEKFHEIHYAIPINLGKPLLAKEYDRILNFKNVFPMSFDRIAQKAHLFDSKTGQVPAATSASPGMYQIATTLLDLEDILVCLKADEGRDLAVRVTDMKNNLVGFGDKRNVNYDVILIDNKYLRNVYVTVLNFADTPSNFALELYTIKW